MKETPMTQILHLCVSVKCDLLLSHFEVSCLFDCAERGRYECVGERRGKRLCTSVVV